MKRIISCIIALFLAVTIMPVMATTVEAATKITDKSVYYVTGYRSGDCVLTSNIYMMRRAAILRDSTKWSGLNNTSVPLRSAICVGSSKYSSSVLNKYTYTYDGLTFKGNSGKLSGSVSQKKKKLRTLLKKHPEGIVVWARNCGKGYPHAVLLTEYKNGTFYCAEPTYNADKYKKKGKNKGIQKFSQCTITSMGRLTKYWYLEEVKGVAESKPLVISNVASTGKPVIKWNRVLKAKKYKVQRKLTTSSKYTTIATVTSLSYTDKKAIADKKYHYRIKAYNSKGKCIFTGARALRTCDFARPTIKEINNNDTNGNVKITFAGVDKAERYYIYRATTKNGEYKYLTKVNCSPDIAGNLHSVESESETVGKIYYYRVRAISKKNSGAHSAKSLYKTGSRTLAMPEMSLVLNEEGNIVVSWGTVASASSYCVYRATSADGEYELIADTNDMSFTDKDAVEEGKEYYYKVKAIYSGNEAANSEFSAPGMIIYNAPVITDEPTEDEPTAEDTNL